MGIIVKYFGCLLGVSMHTFYGNYYVYLCVYIALGDYLCVFMCIYVYLCVFMCIYDNGRLFMLVSNKSVRLGYIELVW